jgi:site-specific recombinase XerD
MDLDNLIKQFILDYQFRLNARTIHLYHHSITTFIDYTKKEFDTITKSDIRHWLDNLMVKGYQSSTINNKLRGIKLFYNYCFEEDLIFHNPTEGLKYLKVKEKTPHYLTMDQLNKLRALVGKKLEERATVEMLYATGVRISELAAMKKEHINWSERLVVILEGKGKGKKGRIVLFTNECAEYLKAYLNSRADNEPFVFAFLTPIGKRYKHARNVDYKFRLYTEQLGFKVTPHTLRNTFAAHLMRKGMPIECIQNLLGHVKYDTTRIYARLHDYVRKEVYDEWM